ncbi:hypothetical protein KAH55_05645 [bacterium]|nr:hypothetical protein [bacterium]
MTTRERLEIALDGGTPDVTPYTFYSWMAHDGFLQDRWRRLYDMGFGICHHMHTYQHIEHGVESWTEEKKDGADVYRFSYKKTPVGTIRNATRNSWHWEDWIKTPEDYKTFKWIVEHTEIVPCYEEYDKALEQVGEWGVPVIIGSRTPAMSINVDWAGTEKFCMDVALEVPELFELYEARKKFFIEETKIIANGPGKYVKWLENLTISMLGPKRYDDMLVSVYDECVPMLEKTGKRVMVHYDGELRCIADKIATAPFHMIDSLTEPPEGDMMYDEARAAWPDKVFWANINVGFYLQSEKELREAVVAMRERAGKKAFAFEISEKLPPNFQEVVPIVLDTLEQLK